MTVSLSPTTDRKMSASSNARFGVALGFEIERRLRGSGYLALRDVSSEVHAGIVRLGGHLPTYYLKQVAQAIVSEIEGVRQVINQIAIVAPAGRPPLGRESDATPAATDPNPFDLSFGKWGADPLQAPGSGAGNDVGPQ